MVCVVRKVVSNYIVAHHLPCELIPSGRDPRSEAPVQEHGTLRLKDVLPHYEFTTMILQQQRSYNAFDTSRYRRDINRLVCCANCRRKERKRKSLFGKNEKALR